MTAEAQTNTLRICDELRAYAKENNLTYAKFSLRLGKAHTWISEICTGRKGAHLGVLATLDIIDWPADLIEWAKLTRAEMKHNSVMAHQKMAKCPVAEDAHPWHGVKLYPVSAQRWQISA